MKANNMPAKGEDLFYTDVRKPNAYEAFFTKIMSVIDVPVTYFRETVVEPLHEKNKQYYFHRQFRRVPTIDECEIDDELCVFETNEQFKRDKLVDDTIIDILKERRIECEFWYGHTDKDEKCKKVADDYNNAVNNWFIKYGDIGPSGYSIAAYFKQKHRMIWERRHGKVGTGMNEL